MGETRCWMARMPSMEFSSRRIAVSMARMVAGITAPRPRYSYYRGSDGVHVYIVGMTKDGRRRKARLILREENGVYRVVALMVCEEDDENN